MQLPPYTVLAEPHMMSQKKKSPKGILTCWLILPFLLFLLGLIFFIILICTHQHSTVAMDHAISVTEQLGEDVKALPWKAVATSTIDCVATNSDPLVKEGASYAYFQGIESGYINQIQLNKEYKEVDDKKGCTSATCKQEKGIPAKALTKAVATANRLCVKKIPFDKYVSKDRAADCPNSLQFCATSKVCVADSTVDCPITSLDLVNNGADTAFPQTGKKLTAVKTGTTRNFLIGLRGGFSLPCRNPDFLDLRPSKTDYPLLGVQYSGCDEYGTYDKDTTPARVTLLDYKDLLLKNGIEEATFTSPYFYGYIATQDPAVFNIYEIHRPNVVEDTRCSTDNKGFEKLSYVRQYLGITNRPLFVYIVIGLTLSSIGMFFWIALIIFSHSSKRGKFNSQLFKIVHLIAIILCILQIIIFIHYMSNLSERKDQITAVQSAFKTADSLNCYSQATVWNTAVDKVLKFLNVQLKIVYPFVITLFCIGIVYLVLMLIVFGIIKGKHASPFKAPYSHN